MLRGPGQNKRDIQTIAKLRTLKCLRVEYTPYSLFGRIVSMEQVLVEKYFGCWLMISVIYACIIYTTPDRFVLHVRSCDGMPDPKMRNAPNPSENVNKHEKVVKF